MNIAVIGSGGREHALVWRLLQDGHNVMALPGSDAIANSCAVDINDHAALAAKLAGLAVDLTVIGPEAPLQRGLADFLRARNMPVVGPGQAAARLETSKAYAKAFMAKHGVATALSATAAGLDAAKAALAAFADGVVIKFDGLAAGKGVEVCDSKVEALEALETFAQRYGADATFVLEQKLLGREVSILALIANGRALLLPPAQDHKRLLEGDFGPNTGGMGAICPLPWLTQPMLQQIQDFVIAPTLAGLNAEQLDYRGVLYFGIMVTAAGPKLLEYNVRFGDPETQAILPQIHGDLGALFRATALGDLKGCEVAVRDGYSAAVVVAAPGYPANPIKNLAIDGLDVAGSASGAVQVFHAGTRRAPQGWHSNGGRILAVLGQGATLPIAVAQATAAALGLQGDGLQVRRDIGKRAMPKRCAVLLSGRGSNLQALLREQSDGVLAGMVEFCLVVSNREDAAGIQWAQQAGIATQILPSKGLQRPEFDEQLLGLLKGADIEYVVLAGFMRILGPTVVQAFPRRIFNIHPADTRLHQGLHGYQWAVAQKLKSTKITVHLLDEGLDTGPILAQAEVDLDDASTFEQVQARGLRAEHALYSRAIRDFLLENG